MTNPTATGYYWVMQEPPEREPNIGWDMTADGWEVMFWDAKNRQWWSVGSDYAVPAASVRDPEALMHAWVGPLTPPGAPR